MPDHVDEIAIATLYLVVMMIVSVLIRLAFRFYMLRSLRWDDGAVSLSLVGLPPFDSPQHVERTNAGMGQVFAIVQSGTILAGTKQGLGKPRTILSVDQVSAVEKVNYSSRVHANVAITS